MRSVNISDLNPHPLNIEIYGQEVVDQELVQSIIKSGLLTPLTIKTDNTIISGHRRFAAAKEAGLQQLECHEISYIDPLDERAAIIDFNKQRVKTVTQKYREAEELKDIEEKRALKRMGIGGAGGFKGSPNLDTLKGRASEKVATAIGMKKSTYESGKKIYEAAKGGDEKAQDLMQRLDVGEITIHKASTMFKKDELYGHDHGDEWYTPKWIFDSLGLMFDMDVCGPVDLTHVTTPAKQYLNINDDGLNAAWEGLVWCNPPYSEPEAWTDKCIAHGNGLLLTHIPMNAAWAKRVWDNCDGIRLFQAIEFTRPNGERQRPGSWLQLAAFGDEAKSALAKMVIPADVAENPRRIPSPMWVCHE